MKYYDLTNKELLNAYNASTEYDEAMCCEICTRVGMQMARPSVLSMCRTVRGCWNI